MFAMYHGIFKRVTMVFVLTFVLLMNIMIPTNRSMVNASNKLSYQINSSLIKINTSDLNYSKENNFYLSSEKFTSLSGSINKFLLDAKSFVIDIKNANNDIVLSRKVKLSSHWSVMNMGLYIGRNLITLTVIKNNVVYTKQITIFNLDIEKMNHLDIDVSDSDEDGVINYMEDYYHSNKSNIDSDHDGLNDYQEIVVIGTNPILKDTDRDKKADYDEDQDGDTLTNGYEINNNLNAASKDTDYDDLSDNDETNIYITNPKCSDTDEDGANDGWEIRNGYDPHKFNDLFVIKEVSGEITEYNPVIASIELTVPGDQISTLDIKRINAADNPFVSPSIPGYLGSAYSFIAKSNITQAQITFKYDTSIGVIGQDFQPRIYYINEQEQLLEELTEQTVESGYVEATVNQLSKYILLNKVEFDKAWEVDIKKPLPSSNGGTNIDVVFVVDISGSMAKYARLSKAKKAVSNFTSGLEEEDRCALVSFSSVSTIAAGLTKNKEIIEASVNSLKANGGLTAIYTGFRAAIDLLSDKSQSYGYKMIIILTDGIDEPYKKYQDYYEPLVSKAVENKIIVYTIGTGNTDTSTLARIANDTGGSYYTASSSDVIIDSFLDIRGETVYLTKDINQDGIPDYYNQLIRNGNLRLRNGSDEFKGIDFNYNKDGYLSDDYDGDGLKNGQELNITKDKYGRVILDMYSDPMMVHSDCDKIDDYVEYIKKSNPLNFGKSKYDVDYLLNNDNFNYENYISMYDEGSKNQLDYLFLATLISEWDSKVLDTNLLLNYFDQYTGKEEFEELKLHNECMIAKENLIRMMSEVGKYEQNMLQVQYFKIRIKNLISTINECETEAELSVLLDTSFKAVIEQVNLINTKIGKIVIYSNDFSNYTRFILEKYSDITPKQIEHLDGKGIAFKTIGPDFDITQTISSIAKINANSTLFERSLDILYELKTNGSRVSVKNAAVDIIILLGEGYGNALLEKDANGTIIGFENEFYILASINPYVRAVEFARNAITPVSGIKEALKSEIEMCCLSSFATSIKNLFYEISWNDGKYYYSRSGDESDLVIYLTHLAKVRTGGENKYSVFKEMEGRLE